MSLTAVLKGKSLALLKSGFESRSRRRILSRLVRKPATPFALLAAATAVGVGLRFYRLGKWSFWRDELFSVGQQEDGFNYTPIRHSLSLFLIRQVVRRRGLNERNARLVPAAIGALTVPLLYPPLRRMFNPPVALAAAVLLALSPWHLYWSQNARFYTLLLLFYSLALFAFYLGLEEDRLSLLFASVVLLGMATRERLLALFFVPVVLTYLALLFLLRHPRPPGLNRRNLLLFFLPGALLSLFFARPYLLDLSGWMEGFGHANNSPAWVVGSTATYVGLPVVALAAAGTAGGLRKRDRGVLLLASGAFVPVGILALIAPFHYTANRYSFVSLTSWIGLASYALVEALGHRSAKVKGAVFALPFLHFLLEVLLYFTLRKGNRDDWKGAFRWIKDQLQEGDRVFSTDPEMAGYYLGRTTSHLDDLEEGGAGDGRRVWIVEDMVARERYPALQSQLENAGRLLGNFDVSFGLRTFTMRVYRIDP